MAEEKKTSPIPEEEQPEAAAPGAPEGPPSPENEVIDLSSVGAGAGQEQQQTGPEAGPAKEGGQEWEKPQEEPEPPRRGRRPKSKEAPAQGERPKRKGRPPKAEKQTPGGGGAGKTAKTATRGKAAGKSTPAKEEIPPPPAPAPEEPPQPKDASRGEKEEIVYLDLSQLHPFQDHPFGVRDDNEMKGLVSSVRAGGVHQPALVRPREGGGYEIIAGHRRQRASELAGYKNMPCIVRNMTDDEWLCAPGGPFPGAGAGVPPAAVRQQSQSGGAPYDGIFQSGTLAP